MLVVLVYVHVKPEYIDAFREASVANASQSVREPGIARFDVIQQEDDPSRFVLFEVYRDVEAQAAHRETMHYQTWRDKVTIMMAEPRYSTKFSNIFPDDQGWG